MSAHPHHLGAFVLREHVARGGMGSVWRAVHEQTGTQVAVKVMDVSTRRTSAVMRQIRREVSAVAALDHPGIVLVYDYGEIPKGTHPELVAGSPYLVMEWASLGGLHEAAPAQTWNTMSGTIGTILHALGHAHARGVVHRDLKPANLLLCGPSDERPGLKLADFGLAMEVGERMVGLRHSGTPRYMAPEQFQGRWRDYGPTVDLYALGCMIWEWVTGKAPFEAEKPSHLAEYHIHMPPPTFHARLPVPADLEAWLRWLLDKDARARPPSCADARLALQSMGPTTGPNPTEPTRWAAALHTMTPTLLEHAPFAAAKPVTAAPKVETRPLPALPDTWHVPPRAPGLRHLPGAGRALFAQRVAPMVGHTRARQALWSSALTAEREHTLIVHQLTGPSGVGSSRVLHWLMERCRETCGAEGLWANAAEGLEGMLIDAVHGWRLGEAELTAHCASALPAEDSGAASIIAQAACTGQGVVPAVIRLVRSRQHRHPGRLQIMVLEDAELIVHAETLVQAMSSLRDTKEISLLVVVSGAAPLTDGLATERSELKPLSGIEMQQLIGDLLPLSPVLAATLSRRAQGLPGYAIATMRHVVQQGWLEPSDEGFELQEGHLLSLPSHLRAAEAARLRTFLAGRPASDITALQLAAVLGTALQNDLWAACLKQADVTVSDVLIDQLVQRGLALRTQGGGWSLTTSARDALDDTIESQGLTESLCTLAARTPGNASQAGQLLVRAGLLDEAIVPLTQEALQMGTHLRTTECLGLVRQALRCAQTVRMPDADARWGFVLGVLAYATANLWMVDDHIDAAQKLERWALRHNCVPDLARARRMLGSCSLRVGNYNLAKPRLESAIELYTSLGPHLAHMVCEALLSLGHTYRALGDHDMSIATYNRVLTIAQSGTTNSVLNKVHNAIGDLRRRTGDLDGAWESYEESVRHCDDGLAIDRMVSRANQGLILLHRGELVKARAWLERYRDIAERNVWLTPLIFCVTTLMAVYAHQDEWDAYTSALARVRRLTVYLFTTDEDLGETLRMAGDLCVAAGRIEQAQLTLAMAEEQLSSTGKSDVAQLVRATLRELAIR